MRHYTLGTSNMEAGETGWKRGTLHTRYKLDGSRGNWLEAWNTTH